MSGFEIGRIGEKYRDEVRLSLVDGGIGLYVGSIGLSGYTVLTPEQCREVSGLLSRAAENWDALSATKAEIERQESELDARKNTAVMRALFGGAS